MAKLVLIRHAQIDPDPAVPASRWPLSEDAAPDLRALQVNPAVARVELFFSSPEPKALATASFIAGPRSVEVEPDLRELDRSAAGWLESPAAFGELVAEILRAPERSIRGCEPAAEAQRRVVSAVERIVAAHPDRDLAIVSHGIVLTLYLSALRGLASADLDLWRRIRFPDLAVVDPERRQVRKEFGTWPGRDPDN